MSLNRQGFIACLAVLICSATALAQGADGPEARHAVINVSQLEAVIGDNGALASHQARYNGIFSLGTPDTATSPFVDRYAGLNLEHYFDGGPRPTEDAVFFEPRNAPLQFTQVDQHTIELHQPKSPHFGVESWSTFTVRDPYYVDLAFRCVPHQEGLKGGFFGVFWASYINEPIDKSIYFLAEDSSLAAPVWRQLCTQRHGLNSTVRPAGESADLTFDQPGELLYANLSPLRHGAPFFYGRVENFVVIYMFKPGPGTELRFAHSPSGGGKTKDGTDTNPAWDCQMIVPEYEVGKTYQMDARVVYKPWKNREDVLAEARAWLEAEK